ncbi:hypothetical protein CYMTET_16316 [Cymbomonas tetramitiformis]|uniref:riboflavin kinase n=1 Tax=Cymbomonas tetramitiformis TaxID=36881 RepID=A0AAE0GC91_9CHLO|nr:hypothetical protein CYMTET_16316 [Cymbomonas tetramitiformis]
MKDIHCGSVLLDLDCSQITEGNGLNNLPAGVERLVVHLEANSIPYAVSPSLRQALENSPQLRTCQTSTPCLPESDGAASEPLRAQFQAVAHSLGLKPEECLIVVTDLARCQVACDLGMTAVALAERKEDRQKFESSICALSSLFDLRLEEFGLPAFTDWVDNVLPLAQVLRCKGPVVKGFGRGSKMLGIPTANLEAEALAASLQEVLPPCGIYGGWASVGNSATVYQMVMSIGWNPYFDNKQKSVEPWLLHEFPEDFYGEELRLLVDHYIRPEANFTTLEALVETIHNDADVARGALQHGSLASDRDDAFLKPNPV